MSARKPMTDDQRVVAQILELERELKQREYVYPRMIERGTLNQATAERRTGLIRQAIKSLEHYREFLKGQLTMF